MSKKLEGKTAFVTGASRGIGAAIVQMIMIPFEIGRQVQGIAGIPMEEVDAVIRDGVDHYSMIGASGALMGLMAVGEIDHPAVARGIQYLQSTQREHGLWDEARYTATGFPRVFYLRYHGYRKFFPLWALARYRNMKRDGVSHVTAAM